MPCDEAGRPRLDARGDVFQLGVLALSMLLARRMTRDDVDHRLRSLLDEWSEGSRSQLFGEPLREWLERALQMGDRPYHSAADAHAGLRELPAVSASTALEFLQAGADGEAPLRLIPQSSADTGHQEAKMGTRLSMNAGPVSESPREEPTDPVGTRPRDEEGEPTWAAGNPPAASRSRALRAAIVIVLVAAVVEGVVIATLLVPQPRSRLPRQAAAPSPSVDVPPGRVRSRRRVQLPCSARIRCHRGRVRPSITAELSRPRRE